MNSNYYYTIDVGGTDIKGGIVDKNGNIISTEKIKNVHSEQNYLENNIIKLLKSLEMKSGLMIDDANGIGIGVPGNVDSKNGILKFSGNLELENYPLKKILSKHFKPEVRIANDAEVATLAELHKGYGEQFDNFAVVTIGTGIGCGLVLNKTSLRSISQYSCEFGHIKITDKPVKCTCGETGCYEAIASTKALVEATKLAMKNNLKTKMWETYTLETVSGKTVFDYKDTDETAKMVFDEFIKNLGTGLVNLLNIVLVDAIVLGGAISNQKSALTTPLEQYINSHIYAKCTGKKVKCKISKFKNDAGLLGARYLFN